MKIIVSRQNYTIEDDYIKIGEFYDRLHVGIFLHGLLVEASDNDPDYPQTFKIEYIPDEAESDRTDNNDVTEEIF